VESLFLGIRNIFVTGFLERKMDYIIVVDVINIFPKIILIRIKQKDMEF
jgi:hypothetical protein